MPKQTMPLSGLSAYSTQHLQQLHDDLVELTDTLRIDTTGNNTDSTRVETFRDRCSYVAFRLKQHLDSRGD